MARQFGVLAVACVLSIQTSFSQSSSPGNTPGALNGGSSKFDPALKDEGSVQAWREYFQQLPPEEKAKLEQNLQRWQALSPEEREFVRLKEAARQEKMRQAAGEAIAQSGLTLTPEQREAYIGRYAVERGAIEEPLRAEIQRERKPLVDQMTKKLNAELAALPPASPAPQPSAVEGSEQPHEDVSAGENRKFQAWQQHSPAAGEEPLQRMERRMMKKKILQEIDGAMKESGLNMDDERRRIYSWRYIQMRRKIEQQLREEMEMKRKPQLDAMVARLKSEFSPAPQK